jgi:cholesterol oxidase
MKRGTEWLSRGAEQLAAKHESGATPVYDFVIVGSGYGGAVAAARLAARKHPDGTPVTVCVLERGLEYLPGDFPSAFEDLPAHVRYHRDNEPAKGFSDGLFDFKLAGDVSALVGNGLGGGSLINAGVAEEADAAALGESNWPKPWRSSPTWPALYERARGVLGVQSWSREGSPQEVAMGAINRNRLRTTRLTIEKPDSSSPASAAELPTAGCLQCGDCFSGCNVGAKRTLSHSYLRTAWRHGAEFYTGATVNEVRRRRTAKQDQWVVQFRLTDEKRLRGRNKPFEVLARNVVLSAGTFGTTEILFRSRGNDLSLSPRLGERFSANGDTIGAQYGLPALVDGYAAEDRPRAERDVGPTISHLIDLRKTDDGTRRGIVIENMVVPAAMGWVFGEVLTSLMVPQRWTRADTRPRSAGGVDPYVVDDGKSGAVRRTLLVATQGDDGAKGVLLPSFSAPGAREISGVRVRWEGVGELPCFSLADKLLAKATPTGAHWLRNPMWQGVPDSPLLDVPKTRGVLTVHPLGGCAMSDTWRDGVVDPFGRVHKAPMGARVDVASDDVHAGLYVLDGSIVPISLGINPLLTITALAEGCVDDWLLREHAASIASSSLRALPAWPVALPAPESTRSTQPTVLKFSERMTGAIEGPREWAGITKPLALQLSMVCDFQTIENLAGFVRQQHKSLTLNATFDTSISIWNQHRLRFDAKPALGAKQVLADGSVYWFEQQPIGWMRRTARSAYAWFLGRLRADLGSRFGHKLNRWSPGLFPEFVPSLGSSGTFSTLVALFKALTHFGAPRLLRYEFGTTASDWVLARDKSGEALLTLPKGTRLFGAKSLVYKVGGNPWEQLTKMDLMASRPGRRPVRLALMTFDELYMIDRDRLPLTLISQANGVSGVRDVLSLVLYFGRVLAGTHFPNFRAPNYSAQAPLHRLPRPFVKGESDFSSLEIEQHRFSIPTRARDSIGHVDLVLTRLRTPQANADPTPILMLHGFGASGSLYTHRKIKVPMAAYLAQTQGRDVWVGEFRTSVALESSFAQWTMDDVAQEDVPALVREVLRLTNHAQLDIMAHCIGSAMFCMAALSGRLAGLVRRAVLMQVGPVVHLPRTNRLRGYLGHRARQWLGQDVVHATMDDRSTETDQLLDRVLGSYPYLSGRLPGNWQDRTLEPMRMGWTLRSNQRRLNVLRSAGTFGQLFQWKNMDDPALLDALPDLLGHCNLTTYQQTVYYAFARRLTNQAGEDAYVTDANVLRNMAFPVLFVQGDLNDTFDRRGTLDSARLLKRVHGPAHPVYRTTIPGYGHLDCVVGKDAPTLVYPRIGEFLAGGSLDPEFCDELADDEMSPAAAKVQYRQPVVGPWIGQARIDDGGNLGLRLGLKADDQRSPPPWIVTVLVLDGNVLPESLTFHEAQPDTQDMPPEWADRVVAVKHSWKEGEATIALTIDASLVESVKRRLQVRTCTPSFESIPSWPTRENFVRDWLEARRRAARQAGFRGLARQDKERVDQICLMKAWLQGARQRCTTRFALGSCRQTPLLIDRELADASFRRLLLNEVARGHRLDHLLMVGDQIYADAAASVESVRGTRARFSDAHREAWTAPAQRELMRRLPTYMAIDDHEFTDNYSDTTRKDFPVEFRAARDAWWRYQLSAGPAGAEQERTHGRRRAWYEFSAAGFAYFLCDSRSERFDGGRLDRSGAFIMGPDQKNALEDWIRKTRTPGTRPRFIVLPSPLFPFFKEASGAPEYAVRSDAWQRFPNCVNWLLDQIYKDGSSQLVLLCGDYHLFADCSITLMPSDAGAETIHCRCITTSGIYSPYEFANTSTDELLMEADGNQAQYSWRYHLTAAHAAAGYTMLEASAEGLSRAEFVRVPQRAEG